VGLRQWGYDSGAECHIKCTTSSASEIKALKLLRDYIMKILYKANRVVKWHGTNETISHRLKSKSDSSLGLRKLGPEKRRQAR